jgi:hypothetical protein
MNIPRKRPLGVIIFGLILIVTSLDLLRHMPAYSFYANVNHEWPESIIKMRFVGSYVFRLIGLACGVGVLCLSNSFRKLLLGLSWYSVATLPLRHTYQAHLFFCEPIYHQYGSTFSLQTFTWITVIIRWFIDGIFSLSVIYYFTRPAVKKSF